MALTHTARDNLVWPQVVALAIIGCAAGMSLALNPRAGLVLAGASVVLAAQVLGLPVLISLLVASTFVTHYSFEVVGVSLRVEHLVLVPCLLAVAFRGRSRPLLDAAADRTSLLFGSFVAWNGLVSVFQAPNQAASLRMVGWLALDWVLLVLLMASTDKASALAGHGVAWAGVGAVAALGLWVAAHVAHTSFGVFVDPLSGTRASGLAVEPNILASTLAVWAFVALTAPKVVKPDTRAAVIAVSLAAVAVTLTRAAAVGLTAGLVLWAALHGQLARRTLARVSAVTAVVALLFVAIVPSVGEPISARTTKLLDVRGGTGRARIDVLRTARADVHGLDWVVGLGTNSFGQRHLDPTLPDEPTPAYLGNLPAQTLYDSGLVGVVLLGGVLVSILPRERGRAARALGLVVVYVLCATAATPLWLGTTWVLVAIAAVHRRQRSEAPEPAVVDLGEDALPAPVAVSSPLPTHLDEPRPIRPPAAAAGGLSSRWARARTEPLRLHLLRLVTDMAENEKMAAWVERLRAFLRSRRP